MKPLSLLVGHELGTADMICCHFFWNDISCSCFAAVQKWCGYASLHWAPFVRVMWSAKHKEAQPRLPAALRDHSSRWKDMRTQELVTCLGMQLPPLSRLSPCFCTNWSPLHSASRIDALTLECIIWLKKKIMLYVTVMMYNLNRDLLFIYLFRNT